MKRNSMLIGASIAALAIGAFALTPAGAKTEDTGHEAAIKACSIVNPVQPVQVVSAVEDGSGIGFSLVWLNDKDGNLWMCDADAQGSVYSYTILTSDLLEGGGAELIGLQDVDFSEENPQAIAEKVCVAFLGDEGGKVVATTSDGLEIDPGFLVFVEDKEGAFHLCNATADAAVWAFEPIGEPLTFDGKTEQS